MKKLLTFLLCSTLVLGDSSGPTSGTATGVGWTTVANVGASDNAYATKSMPAEGASTQLYISSLGFAIPTGATITGIEATLEHKCSSNTSCYPGTIKLTKTAGTVQGSNKADSGSFWTTSDTTETLGSSTDLWGSTWTVTEVNAAGFGVLTQFGNNSVTGSRTASIDYMALTVYYSPSGSGSHRRVIISQTRSIAVRS